MLQAKPATRTIEIWQRLHDKHDATPSYPAVRAYVATHRPAHRQSQLAETLTATNFMILGIGVGVGLHAAGAPVPATLGAVAGALTLSVAGPLLTPYLRWRLTRLPAETAR